MFAWILLIKSRWRKSLKTCQLYQRLGAFHRQRQETFEIEVSVVLHLQEMKLIICYLYWGKPRVSWKSLELVAVRLEIAATSKFDLRTFDIESTHYSENESRCNEQTWMMTSDVQFECWVWLLRWKALDAASVVLAVSSWLGFESPNGCVYHHNELVRRCSEIVVPLQRNCFSPQREVIVW